MSQSNEIERKVNKLKREIERVVLDELPRKVGAVARNHFRQNFREGGFVDGGLHPWRRAKRQDDPTHPDRQYGPLHSRRKHLEASIQDKPGRGQVVIENPVEYAAIHNEGGTVTTHPSVTPKMRRMAWAKCYALAGKAGKLPKELPEAAKKWRALALTRKTRLDVKADMPQRKFMGDSRELTEKVDKMITEAIKKIKDGASTL